MAFFFKILIWGLFFVAFRERKGERERKRHPHINVREKHQSVASRTCPDQGSNLQPFSAWNWRSNQLRHTSRRGIFLKKILTEEYVHWFERERNEGEETDVREKHWLAAFGTCPDQGLNLQLGMFPDCESNLQHFGVQDIAATNWATRPGCHF